MPIIDHSTWVSYCGVKSCDNGLGLLITTMPNRKLAAHRITTYDVPGRDGILHIDDGLDNIRLDVTFGMYDDTPEKRRAINQWLNGSGKLVFSDDPDVYYNATVIEGATYGRAIYGGKVYDTVSIAFDCQPYVYSMDDGYTDYVSDTADIGHAGSVDALPMIRVYGIGDGTIELNGTTVSFSQLTNQDYVQIDCETGYVLKSNEAAVTSVSLDEFPKLNHSAANALTMSPNVSKVSIYPRWRWR